MKILKITKDLRTLPFLRKAAYLACFPLLRRVRRFQGLHKGQTCFIFGDGTSVKYYDLSKFDNHLGIAVNHFHLHNEFQKTKTAYWLCIEPFYFWPLARRRRFPNRTQRRERIKLVQPSPSSRERLTCIYSVTNAPFIPDRRKSLFVLDNLPSRTEPSNTKPTVNDFRGSMYAAISLAIYLGFERAYLVGFDYQHEPSRSGKWYGYRSVAHTQTKRDDRFLAQVKDHIEVIHVVPFPQDLTPNSISYHELTGDKPSYRECFELTSRKNVALLEATDYKPQRTPSV